MVIGICDDNRAVREELAACIRDSYAEHEIIEMKNAHELLQTISNGKKIHVLFLDIDFEDDMDGMEAAKRLRMKSYEDSALMALPLIIFVSGVLERMPEAFGVHAFQFLVKPIDKVQLEVVLEQVIREAEKLLDKESGSRISIQVGSRTILIEEKDIRYIESMSRKVHISTANTNFECYGKLTDFLQKLGSGFFSPHRSFIVNLAKVINYERTQLEMDDGSVIPISKYRYKDFVDAYLGELQ